MNTLKLLSLFFIILILTNCGTVLKVSDLNEKGYFYSSNQAGLIKSVNFDLDSNKQLLVVPNGAFMKGMAGKLIYFDRIITFDDLEKEIIKNNKQDEVGILSGKIGINNAYRKYKKFLYLKFEENQEVSNRLQLKLINPENFDEIFIGEIQYSTSVGVYDGNTFNPLFNELIRYIKKNSKTYN
jgi:hypothetical protein